MAESARGSVTAQPDTASIIDEMDRVFQLELDTLAKVRAGLDGSYAQAVKMILQCPGKVIVTGMGKSGIIAQKIAATMVSTGTTAIPLHPGDGMHGDVGIVREDDVVVAISKSGETDELLSILLYVQSIGVPVISITARPESTLARNSNLVLFTPVDAEACPLDLAPTASTTAALVVGDALATTLMKLRGFTPERFALLHPGGRLGKQLLLTVQNTMRGGENNPVVTQQDSVRHMLMEISRKLCGAVSVVDELNNLVGLVTDYDVRMQLEQRADIFSLNIADIMNRNPIHIYSHEKAVKALEIMRNRERPFLVLPVLDEHSGQVVGMVHFQDLVARGL
jgi:arabinose-5-phosphate isomerase